MNLYLHRILAPNADWQTPSVQAETPSAALCARSLIRSLDFIEANYTIMRSILTLPGQIASHRLGQPMPVGALDLPTVRQATLPNGIFLWVDCEGGTYRV
jgi:hypothetical protein